MSNAKNQKPVVGVRFSDEDLGRIDERVRGSGLPDRSAYVRSVVVRDLDGGATSLREEVEAALAPALYVLLSGLRRVSTSEQALAVVEQVYLSGAAARELDAHLARENPEAGVEADPTPEPSGEEVAS